METTLEIASTTPALREIGRISLLQITPHSLKHGIYPDETYDPSDLIAVRAMLLTPRGVVGVDAAGAPILDVHNVDHPQARRWGGDNGISVGFSGHYAAMRERFGAHLVDGAGAENLLIESDARWTLDDLAGGLYVAASASDELVTLARPRVAAPCAPFARFAAGTDDLRGPQMRDALRFLHHGQRGFYAALASPLPVALVRVGDRVLVPAAPRV